MNLTLQERIALMSRLGKYLLSGDRKLEEAKALASQKNGWFTPQFVDRALQQIAEQYLQQDKLAVWTEKYPELNSMTGVKNVGIVMAGNIPAVGFHDFLCTFLSGHDLSLKLSSKDEVLLRHFMEKLMSWEPGLGAHIRVKEMLKGCDAYIATGSNNTARYFHYYFQQYPHIIRKNRTAVAILDGKESREELEKLSDDVFLYFGLGCRNVTKLFVPEGYDFVPLLEIFKRYGFLKNHHHYINNFDYNLSVALLNKDPYLTNDMVLLLEKVSPFSPIGVLHYETYDPHNGMEELIRDPDDIQCISGHHHLPFGEAQRPALDDYADGVDTMEFLARLKDFGSTKPVPAAF